MIVYHLVIETLNVPLKPQQDNGNVAFTHVETARGHWHIPNDLFGKLQEHVGYCTTTSIDKANTPNLVVPPPELFRFGAGAIQITSYDACLSTETQVYIHLYMVDQDDRRFKRRTRR